MLFCSDVIIHAQTLDMSATITVNVYIVLLAVLCIVVFHKLFSFRLVSVSYDAVGVAYLLVSTALAFCFGHKTDVSHLYLVPNCSIL